MPATPQKVWAGDQFGKEEMRRTKMYSVNYHRASSVADAAKLRKKVTTPNISPAA
jgi:hypothetical protein